MMETIRCPRFQNIGITLAIVLFGFACRASTRNELAYSTSLLGKVRPVEVGGIILPSSWKEWRLIIVEPISARSDQRLMIRYVPETSPRNQTTAEYSRCIDLAGTKSEIILSPQHYGSTSTLTFYLFDQGHEGCEKALSRVELDSEMKSVSRRIAHSDFYQTEPLVYDVVYNEDRSDFMLLKLNSLELSSPSTKGDTVQFRILFDPVF